VSRYERFPLIARLFGLPFIGGGLFLLYQIFASEMFLGLVAVVPCVLAGTVLMLGRSMLEINAHEQRVTLRLGIGVPMITWWACDLRTCRCVWIRFEENSDSEASGYLLGLSMPDKDRLLLSDTDLLRVRALAEQLSQASGAGVADEATGSGYREPGTMNEPLRHRLMRQGLSPCGPTPPRLIIEPGVDELRVTLPKAPFGLQASLVMPWLFLLLILLMNPVVRIFVLHESLRSSPTALWIVDGLCVLSLIVSVFVVRRVMREIHGIEVESTVVASTHGLDVYIRDPLGKRTETLSADVIESLGVGYRRHVTYFAFQGPKRLLAVADHAVLSFGAGCTELELRWLVQAISHALVSGQT